jgi:hypothetical protein
LCVSVRAAYAGKGEKVVDQVAHPLRGFEDHRHISLALLI